MDDQEEQRTAWLRTCWWQFVAMHGGDRAMAAKEWATVVAKPVKPVPFADQVKPSKKFLRDRQVLDMFFALREGDPAASKEMIVERTVEALWDQRDPVRVSNRMVWRVIARYEDLVRLVPLTARSANSAVSDAA